MQLNRQEIEARIEAIFNLYNKYGQEEYGEGVTQLMHMVQAGKLAQQEGYDNEMILAAFYHDIGHFLEHGESMGVYGKMAHDQLGKQYLAENGFPEKMGILVASHVDAKRYLTYSNAAYYDLLSEASKKTLEYQGGPMTAEEAADYEKDPLLDSYIKLRYWDDQAKEIDIPVNPADVQMFRELTLQYLLAYHGLPA
ncbi:HD domain-containing protein [Chitinophaga pinensis]|uniref:Metal dependent phophohydrolase n=1 Tax=Chitinophaga pinensis (strain ATCC 43595 / DSM 2588 / LMG 13176 / NBRC 15968 / NCIMB 11800 / UQM 2034) TaxID=485918 RepID=A0A979G4C9_CHIPD|nr:HDIG domain-containing metalloprotein [Chitinophaga pinensis]ACU60446.1 metal dependent phophohydrolase [Chitinophaga pinensis DSM 2588]